MNDIATTEKIVGSFLGAAVGDALGWPNEDRSHRVGKRNQQAAVNGFLSWVRRKGWMAQTFEEPILAGEYSDDTQLILATARCLQCDLWWERLARVELPTWLLYERGGGIAVKRAARSWASGKAPWEVVAEREKYWNAGGNGAAMRILPHVARDFDANDSILAANIVRNGLVTHGHPRALVGATLYGFALRVCMRQTNTLSFGALIDELLQSRRDWAHFPDAATEAWRDSLSDGITSYKRLWDSVVVEAMKLLEIARSRIGRGALETGDEALREIGAFDRNTGGAGTVTACSAIFLASRHAASPKQGVRSAASMIGTDADTIASMTGALLGAIHGRECLNSLAFAVQDAGYIEKLAHEVSSASVSASPIKPVSRNQLLQFTKTLKSADKGKTLELPDGRRVTVKSRSPLPSRRVSAEEWRLSVEDGQTLAISISDRRTAVVSSGTLGATRIGVQLYASDLHHAREFYETKLGLSLTSSAKHQLEFENVITIAATDTFHFRDALGQESAPRVLINVANIKSVFTRLVGLGLHPSTIRSNENGQACFCLTDPFGNRLEFVGSYSRTN